MDWNLCGFSSHMGWHLETFKSYMMVMILHENSSSVLYENMPDKEGPCKMLIIQNDAEIVGSLRFACDQLDESILYTDHKGKKYRFTFIDGIVNLKDYEI